MESMFEMLSKGGVLVIPIIFCSVLALAVFFERLIRFAVLSRHGKDIEFKVSEELDKKGADAAIKTALSSASPMGRVLCRGLEVMDQDRETLETVLIHAVEEEMRRLSAYLQTLATIVNITPILGLLGTVLGMIKAFMVIQEAGGRVDASLLAGGIWEAMLTTALGLAVALPAMIMHSYLVARLERYEARLYTGSVNFLKNVAKRRT